MGTFVARRILLGIPVVVGASVVIFLVLHLLPGDPVAAALNGAPATPQMIHNLRVQFGLDRPLIAQYASFVGNALHGDLGRSYGSRESVTSLIAAALPATLALTGLALLIGFVLGIAAGVGSALNRGGPIDAVLRLFTLLCASMPVFWTGTLLLLLFSFTLGWFPATGGDGFRSLVLPALSLGLASAGVLARVIRNSMLEVLDEPHVRMLRARGLAPVSIMGKHVLRAALLPAVTMIGLQLGQALAGAVVTETIFSRAGIGQLLVGAVQAQDYPIVGGVMLLVATGLVVVNILVDLLQAGLDPRVRTALVAA
jgi:ABC-type dipeptide/oligopeptide/nickel transport system permease component